MNDGIFEKIHENVCEAFKKAFPSFTIYDEHPRGKHREISLPCIFNELVSLDDLIQDAIGTSYVTATWETRLLIATKGAKKRQAWTLSAKLFKEIHGKVFGIADIGEAKVTSCIDDGADPNAEGYEVWRLEWTQQVPLIDSDLALLGDGFIPVKMDINGNVGAYG